MLQKCNIHIYLNYKSNLYFTSIILCKTEMFLIPRCIANTVSGHTSQRCDDREDALVCTEGGTLT
jgi:hypothetical protein